MKVKVNEGWQLAHEDGTVAPPGDVVEVDKTTADQWIAAGMASKVTARKKKAVTSSKNKAVTESDNKAVSDASE